jgi:ATP-binding cassette subfamily B (MDR/TAP) protein 1
MASQNFTRSEYDHCVYFKSLENVIFIILVLYVDDMLVANKSVIEINKLKAQLARTSDMKDLGATKQILGIEIHKDMKHGKLWFSQQRYVERILLRFNMNNVKPINIPLTSHFKFSSSLCPSNKEEDDYVSCTAS